MKSVMTRRIKKGAFFLASCLLLKGGLYGQTGGGANEDDQDLNTITTAVPFLMIGPDSRSGSMGNTGVAIPPSANSIHWNPAKLGFVEKDLEASFSYTPWLRELVDDIDMAYVSGYKRLDDKQTIGASLRFFSLGNITFTDQTGNKLRDFKPTEWAVDVAFSRKLSDKFSGGIAARYIFSNLTGGTTVGGKSSEPGRSVAADVSLFYNNDELRIKGRDAILSAGLNISNIGSKMSYTSGSERDFIPINMRLGPSLTVDVDQYNRLTFGFDLNKLLVPTPPQYNQDDEIIAGRDPNVGVASGIFGSFNDAPGNVVRKNGNIVYNDQGKAVVEDGSVLKEELREINVGTGLEYWYDGQFAIRSGFFYEHPTKGNRQFVTIGAGIQYNVFQLDLSYLVGVDQQNPLGNTLRFSLSFNFDKMGGDDNEGSNGDGNAAGS